MSIVKLYTEEQVKKVWKAGQEYWKTSGASITLEELLEHEKPIELPSDEEIEEESLCCAWGSLPFELGAKWILEQIKQQAE